MTSWTASRRATDKLGDRLRASEDPSESDLGDLNAFVAAHGPALDAVRQAIVLLPGNVPRPTHRFKTARSIVEKLKRQSSIRLSQVQDIVGVRMVVRGGLVGQDALVAQLRDTFKDATIDDRRARPQHGYRALHCIVKVESRFAEIQVRTALQHQWAELFEKLADSWGRQIRYGEAPDHPEIKVTPDRSRQDLLRALKDMALIIGLTEVGALHPASPTRENIEDVERTLADFARVAL